MKFRITVLNKPELVARFILEALEVAELLECGVTIHFRQEPGKKGVGLNFLPPGKGPVSEVEIIISDNDPHQVFEAMHGLMFSSMGNKDGHRLN
jgi:hypothetical protein